MIQNEIAVNEVRAIIHEKGGWATNNPEVLFTYSAAPELACCPWRCRVFRRVLGTSIEVYGEAFADTYGGSNHIIGAFGEAAYQFARAWQYWACLLNWSA